MGEVVFNFEGINTCIHCNIDDKMKDIINKYLAKANKQRFNDFYYLYNGTRIDKELTFKEQSNELDKGRKKMNILVTKIYEDINENKKIVSKEIICPDCKENALLDIKNFIINLHACRNNHKSNNILINKFEETQIINLSQIICDKCKQNNRGNTHNNEFYICNNCGKKLCPLCKTIHDPKHNIINYEDKNYICRKHNDSFIKYCKTCKENICIICQNEHHNHEIFDLSSIILNRDELIKTQTNLKYEIDKFKNKIHLIKEIFDKFSKILDKYYSLSNDIINNYNTNKRNYYQLQNIYKLNKKNNLLIKKLNTIVFSETITEIYDFSFDNFYNDNGEKFIGEIKNGLKDGKGTLFYEKENKNKRQRYEGDFKNDKPNGRGILYWNDGSKYEGEWKNDIKEGKGIMYYNNGERYEGNWKNGRREGKGIYYWINGDKYEGDWKNNLREGKGIYYYRDGKIERGNWKKDKYFGE